MTRLGLSPVVALPVSGGRVARGEGGYGGPNRHPGGTLEIPLPPFRDLSSKVRWRGGWFSGRRTADGTHGPPAHLSLFWDPEIDGSMRT